MGTIHSPQFAGEFFRRIWLILVVAAVLAFAISGETTADANGSEKTSDRPIYQYVGRNGVVVFTDDLSRIPAEYRSAAKVVKLPPVIKIPEPLPQPKAESPSFSTRMREWFQNLSPEYRFVIVKILPILILSLWGLNFLRKRTDSVFMKLLLRLGIWAIVILSVYLCYFIFIRVEAAKLIGTIRGGSDLISLPKQKAEELKKNEADRLKSIEGIANQK
jgi:hypothetical protein